MKMVLGFIFLFIVAGLSGMLVFLNQEKVVLVLTPTFNSTYYIVPAMPLGLLVVLSFLLGLVLGYIGALIGRLFR